MSNKKNQSKDKTISSFTAKQPALDIDISSAIASKILSTLPAPEVSKRIKERLLNRIHSNDHFFQFATDGQWNRISDGIQIRLLHTTDDAKSFLIKMEANSSLEEHEHSQNEESYVIDGEVWLEGILCQSGDYHYAKAGSRHAKIYTTKGCTLLVKSF